MTPKTPPQIKTIASLAGVTHTQASRHCRGESKSPSCMIATIKLCQQCADNSAKGLLANLTEGPNDSLVKSFANIYGISQMDASEMLGLFTLAMDKGVHFDSLHIQQDIYKIEFFFTVANSLCKLFLSYEAEIMLSINGVLFKSKYAELWQILVSHYKATN
jgi:hypothetical protein